MAVVGATSEDDLMKKEPNPEGVRANAVAHPEYSQEVFSVADQPPLGSPLTFGIRAQSTIAKIPVQLIRIT